MNPAGSDSGGLVRRVKARDPEASGSSDRRENGRRSDDDDDDLEDYVVDNDSKETRLTLMEEVLLLGLKEKEVSFPNLSSSTIHIQSKQPCSLYIVCVVLHIVIHTRAFVVVWWAFLSEPQVQFNICVESRLITDASCSTIERVVVDDDDDYSYNGAEL